MGEIDIGEGNKNKNVSSYIFFKRNSVLHAQPDMSLFIAETIPATLFLQKSRISWGSQKINVVRKKIATRE